jgi:homopolymeric O-antigen transport system ATP-binding protein
MSADVLTVAGLGKAFRAYRSEWQRVLSWFGVSVRPAVENWVLRGVSFSVASGEAVGIVGQNGAGKSTLLKLITGTLRASEGEVRVNGRIAAILELGMGFNPEFTGRQNVFHAAGLMGFGRAAIECAMRDIEAFADIGEYFDQPLRIYSSGMQVRVAFAVATAFRPELLIVDEALAVGDAAFQRKCFQRIEAFRAAGTTLLFVSHDIETVKKLCSRALFIKNGRLELLGVAKQVCDEYERYLFGGKDNVRQTQPEAVEATKFDPVLAAAACELVYGNGKADIESCWLESQDGQRINVVETGHPFVWRYRVKFNERVANPVFAMMLKTREGVALYGVDSGHLGTPQRSYSPGQIIDVRFELSNSLAPGVYYLNCGVKLDHENGAEFLIRRIDAALVRVTQRAASTVAVGLLDMTARMTVTSGNQASG